MGRRAAEPRAALAAAAAVLLNPSPPSRMRNRSSRPRSRSWSLGRSGRRVRHQMTWRSSRRASGSEVGVLLLNSARGVRKAGNTMTHDGGVGWCVLDLTHYRSKKGEEREAAVRRGRAARGVQCSLRRKRVVSEETGCE